MVFSESNTHQRDKSAGFSCEVLSSSHEVLIQEGWKQIFSFHFNNDDQWNKASEIVKNTDETMYTIGLKYGEAEAERKDGIAYLYRKLTDFAIQIDREIEESRS